MPAASLSPASVRRASYFALGVALVHIVFGAIVRISGSGMGCGDNWPKCYGYWFPPFERIDLVIEVMHRYLAIALFASIAWLVLAAYRARADASVGGEGGVWNAARLALALWFAPALFGAVTVFTGNPAWATVVHKLLATSLIAVLAVATIRAGGLGGAGILGQTGTRKAVGGATGAAVMALLVVLLGGLTAKIPGAAVACAGFPLCGEGSLGGGAQHVQLTHRILAYLLVLHLASLPFLFRKRGEPAPVTRAAWFGLVFGVLQVVWAGWMVTGGFPGVVRSLHQATGILIWVTAFVMVYLARIAAGRSAMASQRGSSNAGVGAVGVASTGARG
ncbi:MAG: COX15/CtaA family protein [Gemmatimonadaceae bacterium]|nr:COX15/CtaA family protein [Gemmatimonadaceae bacterium]